MAEKTYVMTQAEKEQLEWLCNLYGVSLQDFADLIDQYER